MALLEKTSLRDDDRLVIYLRAGAKKPIWQIRLLIPGSNEYAITSSRTSDKGRATAMAFQAYDDAWLRYKQTGNTRAVPTYKALVTEYLAQPHVNKDAHTALTRLSVPYLGDKKLNEITDSVILDYWQYRLTKEPARYHPKSETRKPRPHPRSLLRERSFINPLFKYALKRGYIARLPDLNIPNLKNTYSTRRPTFNPDEYKQLYTFLRGWVNQHSDKKIQRDRFLFQQWFLLSANCGCRCGELRTLTWGNVRSFKEHTVLSVSGKTGKRDVVCQQGAILPLKRLYALYTKERGREPSKQELVIARPDGASVRGFTHLFNRLLEDAGIPKAGRCQYSMRHFYATARLSNNVSPYIVAQNMGTSVKQLHSHYGHVVTTDVARLITAMDKG